MRINIIIPYRPLSTGSLQTPSGELCQLSDGRWQDTEGKCRYAGETRWGGSDELTRAITFINKNSHYKHRIVVIIDSDVYPNSTWLKEFDNVYILKSPYVHKGGIETLVMCRFNHTCRYGISNIPDEEWLCYGYLSDLICCKHWDEHIIRAIQQYGENYVYVPMFTEVRGGTGNVIVTETDTTPGRIWEEWRRTVCCHALTMPIPKKGYFTEDDMDNFIKIANDAKKGIIIEKPGDRIYGYFAVLFMKAKYGKRAMRFIGPGFDTDFDNRLYSECKLMKAVVTNSYVFHPFCEFKF